MSVHQNGAEWVQQHSKEQDLSAVDRLTTLPPGEFWPAYERHIFAQRTKHGEDFRCSRFSTDSEQGKHFESADDETATPKEMLVPRHAQGCTDLEFMYQTLFVLESNIIRMILSRMQPRFKKSVKETSKGRIIVGCLTRAQWDYWKSRIGCPNPSSQSRIKMPLLFGSERVKAFRETISWKEKDSLPNFLGNSTWWCSKWCDGDSLFRAWVKTFGLCWNSHNESVTVIFEYELQHLIKHTDYSYWHPC